MAEAHEELDDFELLNEGITAMQIIEWFEKENPEPEVDWGKYEDWPEDLPIFEPEWDDWQLRLHSYADGWKDALKAIKWRQQIEKDIEHVSYMLGWFNNNPETILWWRQYNAVEGTEDLKDGEGVIAVLWCEMLPVDVSKEDWDYYESY